MKSNPQQPKFKLSQKAILLGLISAAYPMMGYSMTAARVDFVIGNVEVVSADGNRRPLVKGADVNPGDAINTAPNARAQLKFIDGGYISLQPNTEFRVDEYNYENKSDGSERSFFSLLKGGLRAISGAIGHINRNSYKVSTPSATIGIRGTGYKAEVRDEGLLISVGEGAVMLTNNTGPILVSAGKAAFVANINARPEPRRDQPKMPPPGFRPFNDQGLGVAVQPPMLPKLVSGGGYAITYASRSSAGATSGGTSTAIVNAEFNNLGQLTKYTDSGDQTSSLDTAIVSFSATDGIIGWGRWDGNMTFNNSPYVGTMHYIIGLPTAVMPTSGNATYNLMGYTNPTASDFSTGYTVNGSIYVDFTGTPSSKLNLTIANSNNNFSIADQYITMSGSTLSGYLTTTGTACGGSCSTSVNGFFAGANAERVGLSYSMLVPAGTITGVAAFAKQ